jgi:hypothetical protein
MGDDPARIAAWLEAGNRRLAEALQAEGEGQGQERTDEGGGDG